MATSVGGAAARGIETGFGLALQYDQNQERKRATAAQEMRQRDQDALAANKDARDERRLVDAEAKQTQLLDRQTAVDAHKGAQDDLALATKEYTEAAEQAANYRAAGQKPSPAELEKWGTTYSRLEQTRAKSRQVYANMMSRLGANQMSLDEMSPADFAKAVSAGTGMTPAQVRALQQGKADVEAGLATKNQDLILQGANAVLAPELAKGVGGFTPSGHRITRKELIGLDPAPNGAEGWVIPRIRVYVESQSGADDMYYDAPLTANRSTSPDDLVRPVQVSKLMDGLGNLGVLATALQNPRVAAKYEEGVKQSTAWVEEHFGVKGAAKEKRFSSLVIEQRVGEILNDPDMSDEEKATRIATLRKEKPVTKVDEARARLLGEQADAVRPTTQAKADTARAALIRASLAKQNKVAGESLGNDLSARYKDDADYKGQVDFWADLLAKGGSLPPRFAQSGAGKQMFSDIVQVTPKKSGSANDMMANQAEFGGAKAGARAVGTRAANFGLAKAEAYDMADLVTQSSADYGRTQFMPINKALNAWSTNTGDPKIVRFGAAVNSFIQAYARAVSPIGTPTVSDKDHAREMLSTAQSHTQVVNVIAQLKQEMEAAGNAPKRVRAEQREAIKDMKGGVGIGAAVDSVKREGAAAPAPAPAPATTAPSAAGAVQVIVNPTTGERMMLKGNQWVKIN
jgi:hypothetical protein